MSVDDELWQEAKQAALNLLSFREHSSLEIQQKLSRRPGYDQLDFELLCEELIESGWLNHSRFAESFIRGRRLKGQGPVKISHELRQRGLTESEFSDHLAAYSDWLDLAIKQLHKKTKHYPETPQERAKLQRFLQSRGFDFETINQALSQLKKTSDSYPD